MRKSLLGALLAALLVLQMVGCGAALAAEDGPLAKYEAPLEIHFVRQIDDTIEANVLSQYPGQTIEDNFWLDTFEEELNIKVVYDWIVKGGDEYKQKLNVTLASGNIPDCLSVEATPMMQLVEAELIQPLDEVFDAYASDLAKELMMQDGEAPFKAATVDGKLYGIPVTAGSIDGVDMMWIRTDWLESLNMEPPTTMDGVFAMLDAFVNADFDGNGKADTVGMAIAGSDMWGGYAGLRGFFNAYHAYPKIWIEKDGQLAYGSIQPEVKNALAALNDMYNKGYISQEFGVMDGGKAGEAPGAGLNGFSFGQQWNSLWPLQSCRDNFPESQWTTFPIPSVDDTPAKAQMNMGTTSWLVVNKDFEHPEAIVKMVNLFMEKCWGETGDNGKYYAPPEAEGVWKLSPVQSSPPNKNLDAYIQIDAARKAGDTASLTGEARSIQDKLDSFAAGGEEGFALWGWERIYGEGPVSYSVIQEYLENDRLMMNGFVGAPTETMTERLSTLEKLQDEVFTKIILGESPIDEFDKYVEDFLALGGEQITAEVNEWYNASK